MVVWHASFLLLLLLLAKQGQNQQSKEGGRKTSEEEEETLKENRPPFLFLFFLFSHDLPFSLGGGRKEEGVDDGPAIINIREGEKKGRERWRRHRK